MADLRITQLPAATTAASADVLPFSSISGSETRKITAQDLGIVLTSLGLSVGTTAPSTPYNGQVWVDTSTNPPLVKVWNGVSFTVVSFEPAASIITNPSGTAPSSPVLGQLWQDTSQTPDELKMYDGSAFVRVDPLGITQTAGDARYLQITTASSTYLPLAGGTLTGDLTLTGAPTTNLMAATKKYVDDEIAALPTADTIPAGTVIWTARNTAPTGYLKCDGSLISRTTYATLFAAIGTAFSAGDGSTTFGVPDLRGEFVRGWNSGANDQSVTASADSGRTFGSSQTDLFKSHNHTLSNVQGANDNQAQGGSPVPAGGSASNRTTSSTGGTETRPRNVALLACIKT